LIRFSGVAKDETGKPMPGVLGITFAFYKDEQAGAPLWIETQNIQADAAGHYSALLGSATADGVPLSLFISTEAHWISMQISGQPESARVLLLSVPYALKAADAETLGGLPASAFVQTNPAEAPGSATTAKPANANSNANPAAAAVTGSGTADYIPLWTSASKLGNSILYQTGGNVGVATKTPGAKLDTVGTAIGVRGTSSGATGTGVFGRATNTKGVNFGVQGQTASTAAGSAGVSGNDTATTGQVYGVFGSTNSTTTNAMGVSGYEGATKGQVYGVNGNTSSTGPFAAAVNGYEGATTGQVYGVYGSTSSTTNYAAGVSGYEGAATGQVWGISGGTDSPDGAGVSGYDSATSGGTGGSFTAAGTSGTAIGVFGQTSSPGGAGGAFTNLSGGTAPVIVGNGASYKQIFQVNAAGDGFFAGNLNVTGKLTKGSGSFKIDDPLDPANKYLSHSFVESPDMMNVYNGNVTTDKHGLATVVLPDYFEALNRDFRYQLTVIGQFAQAFVAKKIANNRFVIRTSKPNVELSWQVTGIRQDAYANAYRIQVEEEKPPQEQGHYLHPELFGASEQQAIGVRLTPPSTLSDSPTRASLVGPLSQAGQPVK
jgi:hypothetical protein